MEDDCRSVNYISEINAFHKRAAELGLSPFARLLWFALMDIANRLRWKEQFNAPTSILMRETGIAKMSVQRARRELTEAGLLIYMPGKGPANAATYELVLPSQAAPTEPQAAPTEPQAAPTEPQAAPTEPQAAPTEPIHKHKHTKPSKTIKNTKRGGSKPRKAAKDDAKSIDDEIGTFCGANERLKEALREFIDMRKLIKRPVTAHAMHLLLKKLYDLSSGDEGAMLEIVQQSCMNDWQAFYPLRKTERSSKPNSVQQTMELFRQMGVGQEVSGNARDGPNESAGFDDFGF